MGIKKRHHYIPKFYLEGFIDPHNRPYLWVYEKGNEKIIKATSKDIAVEKHYFSFLMLDGERNSDTLENVMAEIEKNSAPVFRKIIGGQSLSKKDRAYFATFLAFMMVRVPNFRKNIENAIGELMKRINMVYASNRRGFEAMIKRYEKDTHKKINMPIEELRKWVLEGEYDIKANPEFALGMALSTTREVFSVFLGMKWTFVKATDEYKFLTGDNPLFYCDPTHDPNSFYGVGLLNKNVEVTFPISKDLALFASWKGKEGYIQAKNKLVKDINRRTVLAALRFVFSSERSDGINKLVQKHKNSSPGIRVG